MFFVVNHQNHFSGLGLKTVKKEPKKGLKRAKKGSGRQKQSELIIKEIRETSELITFWLSIW